MPTAPTARMRSLSSRWLTDCVELASVTAVAATRANMADGDTNTAGTGTRYSALVRQPVVTDTDTTTANRAVRELVVWVDDCAPVSAGQQCTIVTAGDSTLVGEVGIVQTVERDSIRAARRFTVRLPNDV